MILMIRKPKATWFPETVASPFRDPRYKKYKLSFTTEMNLQSRDPWFP